MRPPVFVAPLVAVAAVAMAAAVPASAASALVPSASVVAGSPSRVVLRTTLTRPAAQVRSYWTERRMLAARPAELAQPEGARFARPSALDAYLRGVITGPTHRGGPSAPGAGASWNAGGLVAKTTGKVFFTLGSGDYVCSGSAVASADRSTVLTAGHCVVDPESGSTATNWIFVPGYRSGKAPYGVFVADHLATTTGWAQDEDFDVDVAFANVGGNASGVSLVDAVGGQPIGFGAPRGQSTYAFGYPAAAPYTGEQLVACSGRVVQDLTAAPTTDQGLTCSMTPGSSGGPWFSSFDPRTGTGTLTSVTSFSYTAMPGVLWGPYLGAEAQALYASVASTPTA